MTNVSSRDIESYDSNLFLAKLREITYVIPLF